MAEWAAWYAQYTCKTIFVGGDPSATFKGMPALNHLQYITRVKRVVFPRDRRIENHSMKLCWEENGWDLPSKYLPSVPNIPAGYKAFWRYDKPEKPIEPYASRMSMAWTQRHFQQFMGGARVLPADLVRKEMDSSTSCGYPWNMTYSDKDNMYKDARMSQVIPDYSALIRTNYPCGITPIWTCSVKGREMRPVEKIQANNLRTFTAAPVEHSTATNELCLDMNDRFYSSAGYTWSQVGATKFDGQWHALYSRLNKHRNAAALDGKQFDASLLAQLLWDQMWIRWEMLEPEYRTMENLLALMNIYDAIISSVVVLDCGDLIRKFLGNPSGSSNTVVDNTMVLFRFMCIAWIILSKKYRNEYMNARTRAKLPIRDPLHLQKEQDIEDFGYECFLSNVAAALYGDDDTFTVSDFVREWFTPRAIAEVWTEMGLTTTADNWEFAELETLTFLSQNFVCVAGLWMPSPETEKVLGSLYLGSSVDDIRFHLLRAYALRIESWANPECRKKIETYINFVHQHYRDQLCGSVKDIEMSSIRQVWKTDRQIFRLYSGEESWTEFPPAWRLVGVELNPGPARTGLIMHILFKSLSLLSSLILCHYIHTSVQKELCCVVTIQISMTKIKKKIKKAAKKEAAKEVKKIIRKKGPRMRHTKRNVLHGKGGYWGDLGKSLGGHLGGVADTVITGVKKLTGRGSYRVKSNTLMETGGPPSIVNSKHTSIVRHREFLGDVVGSTGFNITQYSINPGVSTTFPWLAASAAGYEQWRMRGCVFEFNSTCATSIGSTNTALGTVIMATEYNSNLPPFTSKIQMENHEFSTALSPDTSAIHPVECARGQTPMSELYVRTSNNTTGGSNPSTYNPLLYDLGQFYLATVGMQAAATIGELWVSYEIEFYKPTISTSVSSTAMRHFYWDSTLGVAPANGAFLQNTRDKNTGDPAGAGVNTLSWIPPGSYILLIQIVQSSSALAWPPLTLTNGSLVNMFQTTGSPASSAGSTFISPPNATASVNVSCAYGINFTNVGKISFGTVTSLGTVSSFDMFLMPIGSGLTYAETRKAVDWDPIAILSRKLLALETKLNTIQEEEEEKYCASECSTPIHVEPDITQSTANLAESLLARIGRRNAVTSKTALGVLP